MTQPISFEEAVEGLIAGDFSRLAPQFEGDPPVILRWYEEKRFDAEPAALAEAFSNACFIGQLAVVKYWLAHGLNPSGGIGTGLNAFHWAANRGQLAVVKLLIQYRAPLETKNAYGGTVLGSTLHAAIHEPKPDHLSIIETLIDAGARLDAVKFPTGNTTIDELIRRKTAF